jgi:genome maintenance exonuclease 1
VTSKIFIEHNIPKLERVTMEDGTRVYQTPTGKKYPSVTTVTGMLSKQAIMEWRARVGAEEANRVSARASRRGTAIHSLCEKYLKGEPCNPSVAHLEMFNSMKPYLDNIDEIHALETPLYSDHLEVAGTVDCIARYMGKIAVIDFKTSTKIKAKEDIEGYFLQTSAYAVAFEERTGIPVNNLLIIMGIDNEQPALYVEKRDDWIGKFIKLRSRYKKAYNI